MICSSSIINQRITCCRVVNARRLYRRTLDRLSSTIGQVSTVIKEGKLFAETASGLVEAVSVTSAEMARLPYDLSEGLYAVGTGSTGAAEALGICGKQALLSWKRRGGADCIPCYGLCVMLHWLRNTCRCPEMLR